MIYKSISYYSDASSTEWVGYSRYEGYFDGDSSSEVHYYYYNNGKIIIYSTERDESIGHRTTYASASWLRLAYVTAGYPFEAANFINARLIIKLENSIGKPIRITFGEERLDQLADTATNNEKAFNALYSGWEEAGTIDENTTLYEGAIIYNAKKIMKKIADNGIGICPKSIPNILNVRDDVDRSSYVSVELSYDYTNPAQQGEAKIISHPQDAVIVIDRDITFRFRYTQEFEYDMKYLGYTIRSRGTGGTVVLQKKKIIQDPMIPHGGEGTFTIPAGTLEPNKQYTIFISAMPAEAINYVDDADSDWVVGLPEFNFSTKISAMPGVITEISPTSNSILLANRDNVFTYKYTQEFGLPMQYLGVRAVDLNTGEITTIFRKHALETPTESGGTGTFTIPAGTLKAGTYQFEFSGMTANAPEFFPDDSAEWNVSSAQNESPRYTVKVNPETSGVSSNGKPVPTVSWTAASQAAYQVRFGDYNSGGRIGGEGSFIVPMIFADGNYAVQIRTATAAGEWSPWTDETYITVKNVRVAGNVVLSADNFGNNIRLTWTSTVSSPDNFAVFRDGVLVAVLASTVNVYVDKFANGTVDYQVYAMKNGYYAESNVLRREIKLPYDVVSADDGTTYRILKYTPTIKNQNEDRSTSVSYAYYAGRSKPIAVSAKQRTRKKNFSYIFKNRLDAEEVAEMGGEAVLLKTTRGAVIYGIMNEINVTDAKYPIVGFTITEILREGENVEYTI